MPAVAGIIVAIDGGGVFVARGPVSEDVGLMGKDGMGGGMNVGVDEEV